MSDEKKKDDRENKKRSLVNRMGMPNLELTNWNDYSESEEKDPDFDMVDIIKVHQYVVEKYLKSMNAGRPFYVGIPLKATVERAMREQKAIKSKEGVDLVLRTVGLICKGQRDTPEEYAHMMIKLNNVLNNALLFNLIGIVCSYTSCASIIDMTRSQDIPDDMMHYSSNGLLIFARPILDINIIYNLRGASTDIKKLVVNSFLYHKQKHQRKIMEESKQKLSKKIEFERVFRDVEYLITFDEKEKDDPISIGNRDGLICAINETCRLHDFIAVPSDEVKGPVSNEQVIEYLKRCVEKATELKEKIDNSSVHNKKNQQVYDKHRKVPKFIDLGRYAEDILSILGKVPK